MNTAPEITARYETITTLGEGGMARVLLTVSRGVGGVNKLLVVKELKAELKDDPEFITMFMNEARIAACLNHPNVIQIYEVSSDGEHPVIVMEYLEGQPLNMLLARVGRTKMPLDLHLLILTKLAAGLHYAHEIKALDGTPLCVVHRDVSPHNAFVTYDGQVKLVDFGIAKAADSVGRTQIGHFKGKLAYASPEQLDGMGDVDRRCDIFALGVMLWEALAQQRLATSAVEPMVIACRRIQGLEPKIRTTVPNVPEELAQICEKAMATHPSDRFATAAEFRAAIEAYLENSKRPSEEQLGALIRQHFESDRAKVKALVEERMRAIAAGEPVDSRGFSWSGTRSRVSVSSISGRTLLVDEPAAPSESTMERENTALPAKVGRPGAQSLQLVVGGGAAVLVLGLLVAVVVGARQAKPSAAADSTSATTPATVDVSISAEPRGARLQLDEMTLEGNPFHGILPKSSMARRLRATAPGFLTDERLITLDRDIRLELSMKPAPSASGSTDAPSSTAAAMPAATAAPKAPVHVRPVPPVVEPIGPRPAASPDGPGDLIPNRSRKSRPIDEQF